MKKSFLVMLFMILGLMVSGCGSEQKSTESSDKLVVYTSFYTMSDFAKKIGGDRIEVVTLVPPGVEPHDWEPSTSDLVQLEKAKIFIYNGAGLEHWVEKVVSSLKNEKLVLVETAKNIPIENASGGHSHGGKEEHSHGADPHVWLNPLNAKEQMKMIRDGLSQVDPKNKEYYEANYQKYAQEAEALDQEISEMLKALPKREIVVSHAAFGYFCERYGLEQIALRGISPEEEPAPARMAEVIDLVKNNGIKVIFFEEMVSPKVSEVIAKETGAKTAMLNPLEGLNEEEAKQGADYFSVMRRNAQEIKKALTE